ncbi:hypothetical protein L1987_30861 [Smallanthus sonchifolius]|uniref:Uncharacterized protein n=1 Tax=Smallanthus sonchifolius TaxID=185202 RepID=A0ACB9I5E5_9ASTR|nr:hypothetical protein L1987_30861 [Smallanthus sonchifolius]
MEKLKISYDGLKDVEKELFLDIACFFRGKQTYEAIEIFEACDFHPEIGIEVLRQKGLITIVDNSFCGNTFDMHDLVEEMGHYIIIRGEYPKNPKKHSRVWKHEEIKDMFFGDAIMENDNIEVLTYNSYSDEDSSHLSKIVSNMKKLRWLSVTTSYEDCDEGPTFLSNELRNDIENGCAILQLEGVKVVKEFRPPLVRGRRCRLHLPENWSNDFCGFLMCAVFTNYPHTCPWISMFGIDTKDDVNWLESDSDSQDDVVWDESHRDGYCTCTWVGYVSFGSLKLTTWWDQTYEVLSFSNGNMYCTGFGVRLVSKKSKGRLTEKSRASSSHYTPKFKIKDDSVTGLVITLSFYDE